MIIKQYPDWKNYENRKSCIIKHLVVHSFALTVEDMINILKQYGFSVHYIIDTEGNIIQLVSEDKLAHHAGKSYWRSEENLNETSIGIEMQNMTLGQTAYSERQLYSFRKLAEKIIEKYDIRPYNVVGHSDIAPTRKVDPGKAFPWSEMAKYGMGLWTDETADYKNVKMKSLLQKIGYDTSNEKAALYAFIRHFIPSAMPTDENIYKMEENLLHNIENCSTENNTILGRLKAVAELYRRQ